MRGSKDEGTFGKLELRALAMIKPCPFCGSVGIKDGNLITCPTIGDDSCCATSTVEEWQNAYCWKQLAALQKKLDELEYKYKPMKCRRCSGTGFEVNTKSRTIPRCCKWCNGSGVNQFKEYRRKPLRSNSKNGK